MTLKKKYLFRGLEQTQFGRNNWGIIRHGMKYYLATD